MRPPRTDGVFAAAALFFFLAGAAFTGLVWLALKVLA
jgi:hypothetical protein